MISKERIEDALSRGIVLPPMAQVIHKPEHVQQFENGVIEGCNIALEWVLNNGIIAGKQFEEAKEILRGKLL